MKICFIAPANNYHTKKWCEWFSSHGHEVHVLSFIEDYIPNVEVHYFSTTAKKDSLDLIKIFYLFQARKIRNTINEINPDIINVHYASSYGAVVALSGIQNYILSVWGSDIFEFPNKSPFHKYLLVYSLKKAGNLFSTSKALAAEASKYTNRHFIITPFGVDLSLFRPKLSHNPCNSFTIGTVKSLNPIYGINYLLYATHYIQNVRSDIPLRVRIAGDGQCFDEYTVLCEKLGIRDIVTFLGFISQEEAAQEWANMDVAVIPSIQESFGVSAVEAQACETPVIISDVPGLKEATLPGFSSIVVPKCDYVALAEAIIELYDNPELASQIGKNGREFVTNRFEIDQCFYGIENEFIKWKMNRMGEV